MGVAAKDGIVCTVAQGLVGLTAVTRGGSADSFAFDLKSATGHLYSGCCLICV